MKHFASKTKQNALFLHILAKFARKQIFVKFASSELFLTSKSAVSTSAWDMPALAAPPRRGLAGPVLGLVAKAAKLLRSPIS